MKCAWGGLVGLALFLWAASVPVGANEINVTQGVGAGRDIIVEKDGQIIIGLQPDDVRALLEDVKKTLHGGARQRQLDVKRFENIEDQMQLVRNAVEKVVRLLEEGESAPASLASNLLDLTKRHLVVSERARVVSRSENAEDLAFLGRAEAAIAAGDYDEADRILGETKQCGFSKIGNFICTQPNAGISMGTVGRAVLDSMTNEEPIFDWNLGFKIVVDEGYDVVGVKLGDSLSASRQVLLDYFEATNGRSMGSYFVHPYLRMVPNSRVFMMGIDDPWVYLQAGFLFSFEFDQHGEYIALYASEETNYDIYGILRIISYPQGGPNVKKIAQTLIDKYGKPRRSYIKEKSGGHIIWSNKAFSGAQRSLGCPPANAARHSSNSGHKWVDTRSVAVQLITSGIFAPTLSIPRYECGVWLSAWFLTDKFGRVTKIIMGAVDTSVSQKVFTFHEARLSKSAAELDTKF